MYNSDEDYWRLRAQESAQEHEQMVGLQREEIEKLQRRCSDLLHEQSLLRASVAMDIYNFLLDYQQKESEERKGQSSSHSTRQDSFKNGRVGKEEDVDRISLARLCTFLHQYSNGLVPLYKPMPRKRGRQATPVTPRKLPQSYIAPRRKRSTSSTGSRARETSREPREDVVEMPPPSGTSSRTNSVPRRAKKNVVTRVVDKVEKRPRDPLSDSENDDAPLVQRWDLLGQGRQPAALLEGAPPQSPLVRCGPPQDEDTPSSSAGRDLQN